MTKADAGKIGGKVTFKRYGRKHMCRIGSLGGLKFWELYTVRPIGGNDFAVIERATGRPTGRTMNGEHFAPRS